MAPGSAARGAREPRCRVSLTALIRSVAFGRRRRDGEHPDRPRAAFGTGQAHEEQPRADGRRAGPMQRILGAEGSDAAAFLVRAGLERLWPLRRLGFTFRAGYRQGACYQGPKGWSRFVA